MNDMKLNNAAYAIVKGLGLEFTEANKIFIILKIKELEQNIHNRYMYEEYSGCTPA